ncbi:uncharacterized protein CEXT_204891 [Caerostris extrusa]|uniref:Uncharacterized protein n=1 Tax=Caerostris extrusa TaxID=172846 RepID=A0AAV4XMC9_CAEEX|nr:uncharacterized protein CEXT_204891 [Caerostris extrusa]
MLSGGVVSGGGCMHDMNPERREKQDGSLPPDPGLRSPGSSATALSLVEFRPIMKTTPSAKQQATDFTAQTAFFLYCLCHEENYKIILIHQH